MAIRASVASWSNGRKAARTRRREVKAAVRGEWELEPRPRGWAAVRAFARQVGELEQARLHAHAQAALRTPIPRPGEQVAKTTPQDSPAPAARRAKRA
jgi:hypothetical protein